MAVLSDVDPGTNPELEQVYAEIAASRGWISNAMRSLAHAPEGLRRFAHFGDYVRYRTQLTERLRELAIVTIGRQVGYAATHHAALAVQAGIPQEAVDEILAGQVPAKLPEDERAAVRYVLEFGSSASVSDATFALMRKHFSERAITDLTLVASYYLAYGTMIKCFRVELESKDKLDIEMRWQKAMAEKA
ncbi:MAG TPA: carboxymuconolactone decarboxylase family protein [Burkholderiaceae bacterium]|jgi:4-carboxymuconolactone decarboxylase|nr:carboxymuconolactone decarboxylase family protein [Burkholderiaceae bacterium]